MTTIPINQQPIEKAFAGDGTILSVHSIFFTVQGEGIFCGRPAIFIRLAGCNLQCPSCDTDYTNGRRAMKVEEILESVYTQMERTLRRPIIVITGGEPFRQNILLLCAALIDMRFIVQVETNGTLAPAPSLRDHPVWARINIVCSPKAGKVNDWIADRALCFKYVLSHDSVNPRDGLPILALSHTANPQVARPGASRKDVPVYLQPCDAKDDTINKLNVQAVVASCLKFGYILQLQCHKLIGVE